MIGGNGAAIVLAGTMVPVSTDVRSRWLAGRLAAAGDGSLLLVTILAVWLVRNHPADKGLEPLGNVNAASSQQLPREQKAGRRYSC